MSTPSGDEQRFASATDSSSVQPPSTQSLAEMRTRQRQLRGPGGAHGRDDLEQQA